MKDTKKRHSAAFKARVALEAAKQTRTLAELSGTLALPFFGASIPGFVGLLTGRGPFSPVFALIPGRSGTFQVHSVQISK